MVLQIDTDRLIEVAVHDAAVRAFKEVFSEELADGRIRNINVRPTAATRFGRRRNFGDMADNLPKDDIPTPAYVYSASGGTFPSMLDDPFELNRDVQVESIARRGVSSDDVPGGYKEIIVMDRILMKHVRATGRLVEISDVVDEYEPELRLYRRIRTLVMTGDN